jgi:serine/threonine protein kinase
MNAYCASLHEFEPDVNFLGEGSFSEVYQVIRKSDNAVYAMKKVKM